MTIRLVPINVGVRTVTEGTDTHVHLKDHAVKVRMTAASTRHVLTCLKEEIIHVTATLVSLEMEHNAQEAEEKDFSYSS